MCSVGEDYRPGKESEIYIKKTENLWFLSFFLKQRNDIIQFSFVRYCAGGGKMVVTVISDELTELDSESNKKIYHVIYKSWFDFFHKSWVQNIKNKSNYLTFPAIWFL